MSSNKHIVEKFEKQIADIKQAHKDNVDQLKTDHSNELNQQSAEHAKDKKN